jgi:hypothetical protein
MTTVDHIESLASPFFGCHLHLAGHLYISLKKVLPEPNSVLGLLALGALGGGSLLKRKLKSSKSTQKETAKVS